MQNLRGTTHYLGEERTAQTYEFSSARRMDFLNNPEIARRWEENFGRSSWKLTSAGPDEKFLNRGSNFGLNDLYDPTNGLTSLGDIGRSTIYYN